MSNIKYFSTSDYSFTVKKEHLKLLGNNTTISKGTSTDIARMQELEEVQLDVETVMTNFIMERDITLVQIGTLDRSAQYVFDIPRLAKTELKLLLRFLASKKVFYAHNAMFEYMVIKRMWEIDLHKLQDTYLLVKLTNNGLTLPPGYNGLKGIVNRDLGIDLSKEQQTSFDGSVLDYDQFIYSVLDVIYLYEIFSIYMKDVLQWKMKNLYSLECAAIRAVSDMSVNGILFDTGYHTVNTVSKFTTIYDKTRADMQRLIEEDVKLNKYLTDKGYIQKYDEYLFKWSSPKIKKMVLPLICDKIKTSNKADIKRLLKNDESINIKTRMLIQQFLDGNTDSLETYLITNYHDELVKLELFVPKDTFHLNFDSPAQRLELFKYWYPNLEDTNSKTIARMSKGIMPIYKKYIKAAKMLSSFGDKMADYIESDNRIHPSFTQLVSTGRMSSSRPNGQNQPSTSEYRNAYYAKDGFSFVGADYSSQEILVATQASGEDGFWHAVKNGYDLHSYSAMLIYGEDKWKEAGGLVPPIGKPKTKEANSLRKASKSLSFSLFYGSSALSLAETLNISHKEAQALMVTYYDTFPKLAKYFEKQNRDGKKNHFSRGLPPFNRVRFYDTPKNAGDINSIGRKSQNAGIQGTSADMTKLALVYIKQYIEKHSLGDKVFLTLQVHDEIICEVHDSIVEKWAVIQSKLMEKAAEVIIPGNWLKAEAEIMKRWNK